MFAICKNKQDLGSQFQVLAQQTVPSTIISFNVCLNAFHEYFTGPI